MSALALVILGPGGWVGVLGHHIAVFPYDASALFSMPLAFLVAFIVSITDRSSRSVAERRAFDAQFVRAEMRVAD